MLIVITGGSGSGKSAYAEKTVADFLTTPRFYVATMENRDEESQRRVDRHRKMRADKHFETIECPRNLDQIILPEKGVVLLECMSNLAANELFTKDGMKSSEEVVTKIEKGVDHLISQAEEVVIVTNEVFSDGCDYDPWTKNYLDCLGKINQSISKKADKVVEVVYSLPLVLKEKKNETDL